MSGFLRLPRIALLALGLLAVLSLSAIVGATLDADPGPVRHPPSPASRQLESSNSSPHPVPHASAAPCGPATAATIALVDSAVAHGIYASELHGNEVTADVGHITGSRALLSALASGNQAAVYAAVHAIVYAPHWHIVRLRVIKAGHVLADVGGPDVIAPVSGPLRWRGKAVGSYVMSVQDDAGYVKLVSRFIGVPIDLYRNGSFLMGTLQPAPAMVKTETPATVGGSTYQPYVFDTHAFPSGALRIALLPPSPTSADTKSSCAAVRLAAWGAIATHVAARFKPLQSHYRDLVDVLRGVTGDLAFVRSGSTRIAGGASPSRIPAHGLLRYAGRSWSVFSWAPVPPARIYFLTPTA